MESLLTSLFTVVLSLPADLCFVAVLLTGCALFGLQQLTGISSVFFFSSSIFERAGVTSDVIASLAVGVANLAGEGILRANPGQSCYILPSKNAEMVPTLLHSPVLNNPVNGCLQWVSAVGACYGCMLSLGAFADNLSTMSLSWCLLCGGDAASVLSSVLVDKAGRKSLLLGSFGAMVSPVFCCSVVAPFSSVAHLWKQEGWQMFAVVLCRMASQQLREFPCLPSFIET